MTMLEWSVLGAILLAILIFCARIMRRGLTTLDDDRRQYLEKIRGHEARIEEDKKRISARDHLAIMRAALEDLIRLDGNPPGYSVSQNAQTLQLATPRGVWEVRLVMRERSLRTSARVLHGKSRWLLSGFGQQEQYPDPASLMRSLNARIHAVDDEFANLPQLARGPDHNPGHEIS